MMSGALDYDLCSGLSPGSNEEFQPRRLDALTATIVAAPIMGVPISKATIVESIFRADSILNAIVIPETTSIVSTASHATKQTSGLSCVNRVGVCRSTAKRRAEVRIDSSFAFAGSV
jgi:hypothetical protein